MRGPLTLQLTASGHLEIATPQGDESVSLSPLEIQQLKDYILAHELLLDSYLDSSLGLAETSSPIPFPASSLQIA